MTHYKKVIDISMPLFTDMVVYPKNPKVRIKEVPGGYTYISTIEMGTHTGTHVDVPRHIRKKGSSVDKISLSKFIGPCRVLDMTYLKRNIGIKELKRARIRKGDRILIKTKNSRSSYKTFKRSFIYLSGDAADYLASKKITLFGIDYLSVKQYMSKDQRAHTSFLDNGIALIEGLNLKQASAGRFFLVCLPLKLVDRDGAPARAVLLK